MPRAAPEISATLPSSRFIHPSSAPRPKSAEYQAWLSARRDERGNEIFPEV
jgi:hypothetical protein